MTIPHVLASADDAVDAPTLIVLLHGFGSNEADLAGIGQVLDVLPWVSLRGPLTLGPGEYAWFPISTPGSPDPAPVAVATDAIWGWIDEHVSPETRIVPIGFSQGGLMATQLLRIRPDRVAATVILGGFVQGAEQPGDQQLAESKPAVFWGRGAEDRVIAAHAIERTQAWLPAHATLTATLYPGLAHSVNAAELADVRTFLQTIGVAAE